jgi:hypothetical protein
VGNVVFRYAEGEQDIINQLVNEVPDINLLGDNWFGGSTTSTLTVYLPKSDSFLNRVLGEANAIYLENRNTAIINSQLAENELLHAFSHEYAHFHVMDNMAELEMETTDIPEWFHEGVAEAFAHRFAPLPFGDEINEWSVIPFSEMKMRGNHKHSSIGEWYIMSHFTVERLLKKHGEEIINNLIYSTKETGQFSISFFEITGEPLDTYHETLKVDRQFINQMITQFDDEENWDKLKQELIDFDASNGPYYYQADMVYHFLEQIYQNEENWEKALEMLMKRMDYHQSSWLWETASEYASNLSDDEQAIHFANKAKVMAEQGGSYFDRLLNQDD